MKTLTLIMAMLALAGCAAKKPVHIDAPSVAAIQYDPKHCHKLNGNVVCDKVLFVYWRLNVTEN